MSGRSQEFIVIYNLSKEVPVPIFNEKQELQGFEPKLKIVKRNVKIKWMCNDIRNISDWRQTTNKYGKVRKNYCEIFNSKDGQWMMVYHTYPELTKILRTKDQRRFEIKGFLNR